jgi:hypothetical protein
LVSRALFRSAYKCISLVFAREWEISLKISGYNHAFYQEQMDGSVRSAAAVVPLVLALLPVRSVCDVGCGAGTWLSVFMKHGIADVLGMDGDYVPAEYLRIPRSAFRPTDLCRPIVVGRTFDLAVSLEVGEHLPEASAEGFVRGITRLAPVVLFSAAIPNQGGQDHINEQWPDYWERLFLAQDYRVIDVLRGAVWENDDVEWWYRQNILLYVRERELANYPALQTAAAEKQPPRRLVHPLMLEVAVKRPSRVVGMANTIVRTVKSTFAPRV